MNNINNCATSVSFNVVNHENCVDCVSCALNDRLHNFTNNAIFKNVITDNKNFKKYFLLIELTFDDCVLFAKTPPESYECATKLHQFIEMCLTKKNKYDVKITNNDVSSNRKQIIFYYNGMTQAWYTVYK